MTAPFDPDALRALARGAERRGALAPVVYAVIAFLIGVPIGALAMVGLNGVRRLDEIRSREDVADLVHSDDKRDEVLSLFHRTPTGGAAAGVVFAVVGLAIGLQRRASLRLSAHTAYAVLAIDERTRPGDR